MRRSKPCAVNDMGKTKIKICGLTRECDIDCVNEQRPDLIGFVFAKSRRQVTDEQAAALKRRLSPDIQAVGVFVREDNGRIISLVKRGIIDIIQLHGGESEETVRLLKKECGCPVIRAVSVGNEDISQLNSSAADYLLLDNGAGGTGKTFDWSLVSNIEKPFFLAGGINIDNVGQGIERFHPFAVDISGGVETDGLKDPAKITEIIRRIRNE